MRWPLALAATLFSASLFGLAFPPAGVRVLAFVCLVPLLLALRSGGLARALGLAWFWAVASAWAIAPFFASSLAEYYERPAWVGVLAALAIFTAMASVYYMLFAAIDRALAPRHPLWGPLLVAAAWTGVELARGRLFTGTDFWIGNPWGLMGYTHASGSLAQIASRTGVYGIGFAIVAVNAGLAGWLEAALARDGRARRAAGGVLLALLPTVAFALAGAFELRAARAEDADEELREVAIAQGDVSIRHAWVSENFGKHLDTYLALSERAMREGSPLTLVWPESVLHFYLETEASYRDTITAFLDARGVELLVGGLGRDAGTQTPTFNSVFQIAPEAGIRARYDKQVLVPLSEYFPFAGGALMQRPIDGPPSYGAGRANPAPLDTRLGRAGVLVCNEAMLPELARERVRAGAELLVSPSNDSWIAGEGFAEHMLAVVGLRAIEQRRYLVRASTSGPSAVIDPFGRVKVRTTANSAWVLRGAVGPRRELTPYARLGDAFAFGCTALVAAALLARAVARRGR